ncbi:hypothetical protein [Roseateles sp. BYS87W]|uniref:Uncharacterized protein n=1 Tax=Pelomonas baiyunensis TaxID=3299026 RepID=A0ABW7GV32_9BURK
MSTSGTKSCKHSKAAKPSKAPKPTEARAPLVRDSFTMPEADYALLKVLKHRLHGVQREAKKSELLRAGLHALAALEPKALVAVLDGLAAVKTGRPRKHDQEHP